MLEIGEDKWTLTNRTQSPHQNKRLTIKTLRLDQNIIFKITNKNSAERKRQKGVTPSDMQYSCHNLWGIVNKNIIFLTNKSLIPRMKNNGRFNLRPFPSCILMKNQIPVCKSLSSEIRDHLQAFCTMTYHQNQTWILVNEKHSVSQEYQRKNAQQGLWFWVI